jgi:hypothetical protein
MLTVFEEKHSETGKTQAFLAILRLFLRFLAKASSHIRVMQGIPPFKSSIARWNL